MTYEAFFARATGRSPFPYQRDLALAGRLPEALCAPTGSGKTAAVVLAWLYRRRVASEVQRRATPRRLIVCLPMRALVTQTVTGVSDWLRRVELLDEGTGLDRGEGVSVHVLMGGAADDEWHLHPERDAIIIGTQDMLLSRVLNRGYAASRFLWPWQYALLTNDCLWIFDEVQLMGVGLATALQMEAFGRRFGTFGPAASLFMSATFARDWLTTVDHAAPGEVMTLSEEDLRTPDLERRRRAAKRLERARTAIAKGCEPALAGEILAGHRPGTRTLVVLNTVDRAVGVFDALEKKARATSLGLVLLHSRFRPADRDAALARALDQHFDGIVVSTQVIEAGVDVSAPLLFTELAPWPSLVQRAGRCNRTGEFRDAAVMWFDHASDDAAPPYEADELTAARAELLKLKTFNPEAIEHAVVVTHRAPFTHVLRRRDVIDLFDTTADLGGVDLDISRFVRDGAERDVQVFWREFDDAPAPTEPRPSRDELCAVPFLALRVWIDSGRRAWRWDPLDGTWAAVKRDQVVPGGVFVLRADEGGYTSERGWDERSRTPVVVISTTPSVSEPEEEIDGDPLSELGAWVPLATHATDARDAAREIIAALDIDDLPASSVIRAAHAHDLGKAHHIFQETMRRGYPGATGPTVWAKSGSRARHSRRGFRHELASALAWLSEGDGNDRDLVAYLLAAHHGKVRVSLRALPTDQAPPDSRVLHARGVWDGETLLDVELGDGFVFPSTVLSLAPMRMGRHDGQPSWVERVIALRNHYGPFRLAYLEALVRAADVRASMREKARIV
ncbi:MAG: CRISPR-associated helicase Cas3' [Acidobacteria bacterium]|nr:MAG: CRISPR-associated helicase Cas3' [Acidobacteriota bacterium]